MTGTDRSWSLPEVARRLGEPQHRLIYLCEKRVVVPDVSDARGRGSSRGFSGQNVLEFALALRMRRLQLPVKVVGAVLHVLRSFVTAVQRELPDFDLLEGMRRVPSPDLRIIVQDGERLFFSLALHGERPKLFGGIEFPPRVARRGRKSEPLASVPFKSGRSVLGGPEGSHEARIEVSVSQIALGLKLE